MILEHFANHQSHIPLTSVSLCSRLTAQFYLATQLDLSGYAARQAGGQVYVICSVNLNTQGISIRGKSCTEVDFVVNPST